MFFLHCSPKTTLLFAIDCYSNQKKQEEYFHICIHEEEWLGWHLRQVLPKTDVYWGLRAQDELQKTPVNWLGFELELWNYEHLGIRRLLLEYFMCWINQDSARFLAESDCKAHEMVGEEAEAALESIKGLDATNQWLLTTFPNIQYLENADRKLELKRSTFGTSVSGLLCFNS